MAADIRVDTGIPADARTRIAEGLSHVLADTYTLYLKTHYFHWNVTGAMFQTLHNMFEEQYRELWAAVDEIAERIRALGHPAPGTYAAFSRLSSVKEVEDIPAAEEMIRDLLEGHETVAKTARSVFPTIEEVHDEASADLLTERMRAHEKTAWMLRSLLSGTNR